MMNILDQIFITGDLPANVIKGEYSLFLVLISYVVASLGSFTGLTLATRIGNETHSRQKQRLHLAGAVSLGSGIWSMHFIGMLAYDMKMTHHYDPVLTIFSGIVAIIVAWFVLKITQAKALSPTRPSISAILLGLGIAAMHYMGMEAMQMDAYLRYKPSLFAMSIAIAVAASAAALWIILTLGRHTGRNQLAWRSIAALVMGVAICGMHYTGMAASVIIPFADCRFDVNQHFPILAISILASTGLIFIISLMLGVANRLAVLLLCAFIFSLPLIVIVYEAVSGLNKDITFTKREQQGLNYHEELIDLLLSLQKLRGVTNIAQHNGPLDNNVIWAQKKEVLTWIGKVDAINQLYGKPLNVSEDWHSIKERFDDLLEEHPSHRHEDAEREFAKHSAIIRSFMHFMETVVDRSNLNTDPQPDSNLVADVLYNLLPETTEIIGEMRGLAAGYLASNQHQPGHWTYEEKQHLKALYSQLLMLDRLMENRLLRSTEIVPDSQRFVNYHSIAIQPKIEHFTKQYEQMIYEGKTNWTSGTLFIEATDIIEAYDQLYDNMIDSFSNALKQRHAEYALKKNMVLVSSTLGLAGFIALFIFLFRSLTKTERAEHKAVDYIEKVQEAQMDALKAKMAAEKAAAAKSDFLANMSHELRTPMNGVLGMAHLLADTPLTEEQSQYVSTINGSGENLLMLLNDILDFSKIEAGALTLEHIAYPVKDTLTNVIQLMHPQADKKAVELQLECEEDIPAYLWGDPGRMRQIIINLIGNAIKFTQHGYVRLIARLQERENTSHLYISVQDTGMGIPADKLDQIFDKFTQADTSVTRKFGGTGLGLAITKQLVTMMGGDIGVESAEGKGSTFWFSIPCHIAAKADMDAAHEYKHTGEAIHQNRPPIAEAKFLLVEDYPVNQVFAEKLLRKFGACHIDLAENGLEALDKYRSQTYDMIFMDCQMPELDGYQAATKLRTIEDGMDLHTPIVAMTANAMIGDREKCLKAGMDDYLSKPLRAGHLKKILETWFILDESKAVISTSFKATSKDAEEQPVDMSQLRIFTNDDPEEEKALVALFMDQAQSMIDLLSQNMDSQHCEAWRSAAHRLKGSSGNLGAMKLHHLCKRAEIHFEDVEPKKQEMLAAIKAETSRVEHFFQL